MENIDWRFVSLGFNIFTWMTGVIAFCIIKWNDFGHLEKTVEKLDEKQIIYENKQNNRHEENIKELANLSKKVSYLCGRQDIKE